MYVQRYRYQVMLTISLLSGIIIQMCMQLSPAVYLAKLIYLNRRTGWDTLNQRNFSHPFPVMSKGLDVYNFEYAHPLPVPLSTIRAILQYAFST